MKQTLLLIATFCCCIPLQAQQPGRTYRTEIIPFDIRSDADTRKRTGVEAYMEYKPAPFTAEGSTVSVGEVIEIPYTWTDGNVYLHLENVGTAYTLTVNDKVVAEVEDSSTPAEFFISPFIKEGKNAVILDMRPSKAEQLNATPTPRDAFSNSYLYSQHKLNISDFTIALIPDSTRKFGILKLDVIARNAYNYDEVVTVGYDIYSPQGKLLDFNITDITIQGRSTDTLHFQPEIYHTYENKWEAGGKNTPPLYKVMLFTRRNGAYKEYMPLKIGFGRTEFIDGKLMRLGKELKLVEAPYNAAAGRKTTLAQLKALKAQGKNTICPDYPQPTWFYELCDELGLYVIDRANINAPEKRDDRTVGGTPSNAPALANEYLERVRSMYYRSRNFTCVIAFALGGESGNGYNMYKAYQWLKSVETSRPIIYDDADGEWNSDMTIKN